MTFLGEYKSTLTTLGQIVVTVDYSKDPQRLVKLLGVIRNDSVNDVFNYMYLLRTSHPATQLMLNSQGRVIWRSRLFNSTSITDYRRTFYTQSMDTTTEIDLEHNEIKLKVNMHLIYVSNKK